MSEIVKIKTAEVRAASGCEQSRQWLAQFDRQRQAQEVEDVEQHQRISDRAHRIGAYASQESK